MKITKDEIKELKPCEPAWKWYLTKSTQTEDLYELLTEVSKESFEWSCWLFTNLMTKRQCVQIAIFSAEKVLHIYEDKYDNNAPRKAIEAAKNWLANPTEENRQLADVAFRAARAAGDAAWDAAGDAAWATAAWAADAAFRAARAAAWDVAWAARAAAEAAAEAVWNAEATGAAVEMQNEIIKKAVDILESKV